MILLYIDPGAGSLVIQAFVAALVAVPFLLRRTVARGLDRLRRREQSSTDREAGHAQD